MSSAGAKRVVLVRGFTLIELMVVIVVIAILATLLLPALSSAKEKAQRIDCISRQKQWAMAFRMYVDDHDNLIPREGYGNLGGVTWDNWIQVRGKQISPTTNDSADVWYNALPEYVGVPRAATYAPVDKHAAFYDSSSLFHCPAAKFQPEVRKPSYLIAIFSMAMNSQLIEFPYGPTINFNRLRDEEPRTVLFLDNRLKDEKKCHPLQDDETLGQPAAYADRFGARHGNGGNLAFADGHVSWFPANKVVDQAPETGGGPVMPPVDIVWEVKDEF